MLRALPFIVASSLLLASPSTARGEEEGPGSEPSESKPAEPQPDPKPEEQGPTVVVEDATGEATTETIVPGLHVKHVPVPIFNNFTRWELWTMTIAGTLLTASALFQTQIAEWRFGEPLIGEPPDIDEEISEVLWSGEEPPGYLEHIDRFGGIIVPIASMLFYVSDGIVTAVRGVGYTGDVYSLHHALAFAEAFIFTGLLTQIGKLAIGRLRPRYELNRVEPEEDDVETFLSFPSGHTSLSFCVGSYIYRDLSDYLVHERDWGFVAGRIVPAVVIYGLGVTIAYQRVADQDHFFTDVLVGAAIGTAIGHLIYWRHFDEDGHPRHNRGKKVELIVAPTGVGVQGSF